MAANSQNYPRTVQEMLDQGWYEKILKKVRKYNLNDILNTPEEIVQDVFTQILQSRYLERYDPNGRPFEVYIYTLAINLVKKRGIREGSTNGRLIVNSNTLEYSQEDNSQPQAGVTYLDRIEQEELDDPFMDIEMQDLIESTKRSLAEFKASSTIVKEGVEIQRDPATVFTLLLEGKSVPEIAEIFETSKQFIYILLGKIRETPEMQEFHDRMQAEGRISARGKRRQKTWANASF